MRNKYFDELVTENDLFYVCYMIEKTSRFLHQRNQYVVNQLGYLYFDVDDYIWKQKRKSV